MIPRHEIRSNERRKSWGAELFLKMYVCMCVCMYWKSLVQGIRRKSPLSAALSPRAKSRPSWHQLHSPPVHHKTYMWGTPTHSTTHSSLLTGKPKSAQEHALAEYVIARAVSSQTSRLCYRSGSPEGQLAEWDRVARPEE